MVKSKDSRNELPEKGTLCIQRAQALNKAKGYVIEGTSGIDVYFPHQGIISFEYDCHVHRINYETARFQSSPRIMTLAEKQIKNNDVPIVRIKLPRQELEELILAGRSLNAEFTEKTKHLADVLNHVII